jgi:hypothetical protein
MDYAVLKGRKIVKRGDTHGERFSDGRTSKPLISEVFN